MCRSVTSVGSSSRTCAAIQARVSKYKDAEAEFVSQLAGLQRSVDPTASAGEAPDEPVGQLAVPRYDDTTFEGRVVPTAPPEFNLSADCAEIGIVLQIFQDRPRFQRADKNLQQEVLALLKDQIIGDAWKSYIGPDDDSCYAVDDKLATTLKSAKKNLIQRRLTGNS